MHLTISPSPQEQVNPFAFAFTAPNDTAGPSAPPDAFARLVDEAATEPKLRPADEDSDEATTEGDGQGCVFPLVPLPPVLVPVPLLEMATGETAVSPLVPETPAGSGITCRLECLAHADAPVTESLKAEREAAAAPKSTTATPAATQQTPAAALLETAGATPTVNRAMDPVATSGTRVPPDVEPVEAPDPKPGVRRHGPAFTASAEMDLRRGMVAAEHGIQMKQMSNQDEIARLLEQNMPVPPAWSATARSPERTRGQRVVEGSLPESGFAACGLTGLEQGAAAVETSPVSDTAPTLAERLLPLVSTEVRLLKQAGPGEVSVLLKPDTHTEIVLHLRTIAGRVEAVVRCERGDFQTLNAEWEQLRGALAPQGVHLLPLSESPGTAQFRADLPANSASFANGEQPQRQSHPAPESLDERPLTSAVTKSQRTARKSGGNPHRLLESWA